MSIDAGAGMTTTWRRRMVLSVSSGALCVLANGALGAQTDTSLAMGGVTGRVSSAATGEPVRATVAVVGAGTRVTDDAGRFVFRALPAGRATVRVRALGYRAQEASITIAGGRDTAVAFALQIVPYALGAVRTRATREGRDAFDEAPNVSDISMGGATLSRVPAAVEPDLLRAVTLLPGVEARNDYMAGYNVRGGEGDQNLVLMDGIPVYNPFHLGGLFGTFIDASVGEIELLTGGFPAQYGGRLSSVLDVSTKEEARAGVHGEANVSLLSSSLSLGGALPGAQGSWNVAGRRTYADKVASAISSYDFPYHFQDAQAHVATLIPGGGTLSATAYGGVDQLVPTGDDNITFDWGNRLAGLTLSQPIAGATLTQRVSASAFVTHFVGDGGVPRLSDRIAEATIAGTVSAAFGAHAASIGYELSRYAVAYDEQVGIGDPFSGGTPYAPGDSGRYTVHQHEQVGTLFVADQWRALGGRLLLRPGLRAEWVQDARWSGLSPRLSAKYFVTRDLAVTAAAGRFTQWLHAVRNEDLPVRIFDLWITSDRQVPVSTATHLVGGVERWMGARTVLRVEGYTKRYARLPEPPFTLDPRIRLETLRAVDGGSYGLDVYLRRLESERFGGWLAYSYGVSSRSSGGERYWPGQDRRHNANAVMSWTPGRKVVIGARYGIASGTPFTAAAGRAEVYRYDPLSGRPMPACSRSARCEETARGPRNGARYPLYERLDLSVERIWRPGRLEIAPSLHLINALSRRNVFVYDFDYEADPPTARTISQFPILPTVGVRIEW